MINLSQDDFGQWVDLLSGLPEFRMESSRWALINDVLTGAPREDNIRGLLDLSGSPRPAAVSLITSFQKFGQVAAGQELLGILANKLLDGYVFDPEPVAFLRGLFSRYPLDQAVAPQPPVAAWQGADQPEDVFEKIIGENTLRDVRLLELALEAAPAVVRIRTATSLGSGFLCGEQIIMTNHHVLADAETARSSQFAFFYELDRTAKEKPSQVVTAEPDGLFFSDETLDVALVQLQAVPEGVTPLTLKRQRSNRDDRVSVIQHPGGHYKKISMQNNFVQYADAQVVQYTTSTEPGSSGSPVFNDEFEVIAIHHSGGLLLEPASGQRYLRNAGSAMIAVLAAVQQRAPDLYAGLRVG
ncbi:MAG: trypsin-like peptidase domain-containing protein [Anaerolineaceae bacterium]|nr:trypsin-like peptidase domain-containing protein [Anaerolineaceae bacterium]